jgi:hypothetical protein
MVAEYDKEKVTIVLTEQDVQDLPQLARAAGLRSWRDFPDHVPTLSWKWFVAAKDLNEDLKPGQEYKVQWPRYDDEEHYVNVERMFAGTKHANAGTGKRRKGKDPEISHIS